MKKVFLAVACVAFVASMVSCKKDCRCITKLDGVEISNQVLPDKVSKKDCEATKASVPGATMSCTAE